ncbi:MAG: hypothetical protein DRH12_08985 [Deltaproteobacteria bacterium]|nr:MAG: hypothetical protein DRH12_08985 [Deltaproteobacteria bacterium]
MKKGSRKFILSKLKSAPTGKKVSPLRTLGDAPSKPSWLNAEAHIGSLKRIAKDLLVDLEISRDHQDTQYFLNSIIQRHGIKSCLAWHHPLIKSAGIPEMLVSKGITFRDTFRSHEDFKGYCAEADLGITAADALIMESGTLVTRAKRGWERGTSLLPPVHLVLVDAARVLSRITDLPAVLTQWFTAGSNSPSAIHLISGPSKTADIEFTLVLGVHGPKAVYILAMVR